MALDKAIKHGKEHRKPYRRYCEIIDPKCRNHGGCSWCLENRTIKNTKRIQRMKAREKDYYDERRKGDE